MENTSQDQKDKMCNCTAGHCAHCGWTHHRRHRVLVAIILILLTFWLGYKLGEMKGLVRGLYGTHMMYRGGYYPVRNGWNDMDTNVPPATPTTVTPPTTPAPTTAQ